MLNVLHRPAAIAVGLIALAALGCGDGRPTRVPVSGKVLIDGQPVTRGYVRFVPNEGRPSGGDIQPDGSFTLSCYTPKNPDGCQLGPHAISVTAIESIAGGQKWLTPQKYRDHATSGLTENIDGPKSDLVINLTWGGESPVVEKFGNEGSGATQ